MASNANPPQAVKVRCPGCNDTVIIETTMLTKPLECGDCGAPIPIEAYPSLLKLRDEQIAHERAEREQRKALEQAERDRKRAEREDRETAERFERERERLQRLVSEQTERSVSNQSALISCPDCGKQISRKASACPHCGRPAPRGKSPIIVVSRWLFGFLTAVFLIGGLVTGNGEIVAAGFTCLILFVLTFADRII